MQTKLTLRLDEALIARAKDYAQRTDRSVSQLVAAFFASLEQPVEADAAPVSADAASAPVLPIVEQLYGCFGTDELDEEDYRAYLEEKHR